MADTQSIDQSMKEDAPARVRSGDFVTYFSNHPCLKNAPSTAVHLFSQLDVFQLYELFRTTHTWQKFLLDEVFDSQKAATQAKLIKMCRGYKWGVPMMQGLIRTTGLKQNFM